MKDPHFYSKNNLEQTFNIRVATFIAFCFKSAVKIGIAKHFSLLIFKTMSFLYLFKQITKIFADSLKFPKYVVFQL